MDLPVFLVSETPVAKLEMLAYLTNDSRKSAFDLRAALETLGQRALARYPRPEGIDPNWLIEVHYEFQLR